MPTQKMLRRGSGSGASSSTADSGSDGPAARGTRSPVRQRLDQRQRAARPRPLVDRERRHVASVGADAADAAAATPPVRGDSDAKSSFADFCGGARLGESALLRRNET